jgi:hypothetical protein
VRFLSLCAYRGMADCNSPRVCPHFVGAFRVNTFSTEFSSGSSSRRARTTITTKSNSRPQRSLPFDIRIRFAIPYPASCAGKGTKRARIEPSQLRVTVFKARKYGFSGLGKSTVIR